MSDIFSNILSDMNAPDCDIATAECGNECHFSILREGVLACGDGIDGMHMYSEQVHYLHRCFYVSCSSSSSCLLSVCVLCCAPRRTLLKKCGVFAFLRASVIAEVYNNDSSFSERAFHLQIYIYFTFPSIPCHACRVTRASRLSHFFRVADFLPRLENYFWSIFYF